MTPKAFVYVDYNTLALQFARSLLLSCYLTPLQVSALISFSLTQIHPQRKDVLIYILAFEPQ